ncbi:Dedicator of cytokinesis protein 9 [Operophtera brumata]|uniref:Dedicator of cytokinesis protein 9 n=1 Tax=Operophtera brumata TaxID=104452 RepID=A0A0L7LP83_OPEBR|nr:Dedicator of cytokinesis protein 9 [Operophtera brumata]
MPPVNSKVKKSGAEYESVVLPRRWRTVTTAVPDVRTASTCPLLTRQSLLSYASSWNLIHYKYSNYSGSYLNLPRPVIHKFPPEVYDIDAETESDSENQAAKVDLGTKEGYLLKGPEIGSESIFSNLASKSFKKRYCSMVREADGAYILEVYKDDKKTDTKLTIVMDFCSDVVKGYTFSTDTEEDSIDWINTFKAALKKNQDSPENQQNDEILDKDADVSLTAEPPPPTYGTLKGLEHSMNPLLMRYSRETDMSIAAARNECRYNVFNLPYKRAPSPEPQLQAPIDGDKELLCQVEPYYTYLAVYDARSGRKVTENFHFDLNHEAVKDLVSETECTKSLVENFMNNPHPDLFLVVKIDKILQGHVSQVLEPYLKATKDPRLGLKVHKTVQAYANRVGSYRMPFAWAAKPLYRMYSNDLDTTPDFPAIYRQDPNKLLDDDLLKILSDLRKPDKLAKLTPEQPYAAFVHHLYVRPLSMNFESQKVFARARNIACSVELRDCDTGDNKPLQAKLRLPTTVTQQHHLLFTFHHISCDLTKKNDTNVETCIGYAWAPLLKNDKLIEEFINLPIATHLPSGYLSIQPLGLGRGNSGPEVVWVEGEKPLFRCQLVLDSTVATRDIHLQHLFNQAEKLIKSHSPPCTPSPPPWNDVCNALKASHAIKLSSLVGFLPTIMNQLFELMTVEKSYTQEMGYQVVKLIIHFVHMIHDYGRKDLLDSYVKYVFNCVEFKLHTVLTAPLHMFVDQSQQDFLLGNRFMQYSGFFFDIIIKSMAQYLINTGRIKMSRNERFHGDLLENIEKLISAVEPAYILQQPMQTHIFNKNLALFLKKYIDKFKACDPKALFDFKFTFLQTICSHEHFVAFNLPLHANKFAKDSDFGGLANNVTKEAASAHSTPRRNRLTLHFEHTPVRNSAHFKDPPGILVMTNNLYGKDHTSNISQSSLESVSTMSGGDSLPRNAARVDLSEIGDQYLDDERLVDWWRKQTQAQQQSFFNVLEAKEQYTRVQWEAEAGESAHAARADESAGLLQGATDHRREEQHDLEAMAEHSVVSAGCLATEVGLTIIDRACLFMKHIGAAEGAAAKPYIKLLQCPQSEILYKHLFAALRAREAAASLYLLMRANFQHAKGGDLTRVHLQVIMAVSKLLDNSTAINCKRFQESLSVINCFATGDKAMKGTALIAEYLKLRGTLAWGADEFTPISKNIPRDETGLKIDADTKIL